MGIIHRKQDSSSHVVPLKMGILEQQGTSVLYWRETLIKVWYLDLELLKTDGGI